MCVLALCSPDGSQGNSTAIFTQEADGTVTVTGSKTEGALVKFLECLGIKGAKKFERVKEVPFTSDRKVSHLEATASGSPL